MTPTEPTSSESKPDQLTKRAPESYAFKAPEGREVSKDFVDAYSPIFKELDLNQDQAQKLFDTFNKNSTESMTKMREGWQGEVKAKYGAQLDEKLAEFGRMKDVLYAGDKEGRVAFETALNLTGGGDNPAIIDGLLRAAAKFTEGTHVSGRGPSPEGQRKPGTDAKPSAAQAMWPTLPSSNAA